MKSRKSIGNMIFRIREERGISQKALCEGICSQKMMSRYERWSTVPDRLSLNLILQRLGKSPEHFITMLTQQEFEYLQWKKEFLEAMGAENTKEMESLLSRPEASDRSCHERLQEQFQQYMSGYLERNADRMKAALQLTLPSYQKEIERSSCVSAAEMSMILLYLQVKGKDQETLVELKNCLRYMELHFGEEAQLEVYPAAVCQYSEYPESDKLERIVCCRQAIELLTRNGRLRELPILLKYISSDMEQIDPVEAERYRNQLWALQEIYHEQGMELKKSWKIKDTYQEAYILSEVLKTYRREAGYSKEYVSDRICDVLSYGRVESGLRGMRQGNYEELAKRLGIPYGKYSMAVVTEDYDCLVLSGKITSASKRHEWDEMRRYLEELKGKLDMTEELNRQYIWANENSVKLKKREETIQEFRENAIQALRITIPKWHEEYGTHFYSRTELQIVNQIAVSYNMAKEFERAKKIVENVWKVTEDSKIDMSTRTEEVLLLLTVWKNSLSDLEEYQRAIDASDKGIRLALSSERGDKLDTLIVEKGWSGVRADETLNTKEKCLKYFLQAFYISELFHRADNHKVAQDYIKRNYGISLD